MLKLKFFFVLLLFISGVVAAQIEPVTESALPLKFDTGNPAPDGLPSTVINIQGKEFPILVDTGAKKAGLALTPEALKNIKVHFTNKKVCFKAMDGEHCYQEFIVPEVKLGSLQVANVKGIVMPKLWGGKDENFIATVASNNGLIGFPLLKQFNVLLDYPQAKMLLVKPQSKPSNYNITQWVSLSFTDHFHTQLKVNGKLLTFSWDTGAIPSIIKQSIAKDFQQTACPAGRRYSKKDCLRIETTSFATTDNQTLPNTWFKTENIPAYASFDGLIGANFYEQNLVYFDFDNYKIFITPVAN